MTPDPSTLRPATACLTCGDPLVPEVDGYWHDEAGPFCIDHVPGGETRPDPSTLRPATRRYVVTVLRHQWAEVTVEAASEEEAMDIVPMAKGAEASIPWETTLIDPIDVRPLAMPASEETR